MICVIFSVITNKNSGFKFESNKLTSDDNLGDDGVDAFDDDAIFACIGRFDANDREGVVSAVRGVFGQEPTNVVTAAARGSPTDHFEVLVVLNLSLYSARWKLTNND